MKGGGNDWSKYGPMASGNCTVLTPVDITSIDVCAACVK